MKPDFPKRLRAYFALLFCLALVACTSECPDCPDCPPPAEAPPADGDCGTMDLYWQLPGAGTWQKATPKKGGIGTILIPDNLRVFVEANEPIEMPEPDGDGLYCFPQSGECLTGDCPFAVIDHDGETYRLVAPLGCDAAAQ